MDSIELKQRAVVLLKNNATAIANDIKLKSELAILCKEIGHNYDKQFKNGCRNCTSDAIIILGIYLKNLNKMENNNKKYLIKNNEVQTRGTRFKFSIMTDEQIEKALNDFPELSKFVEVNKKATKAEADAKADADAKAEAKKSPKTK